MNNRTAKKKKRSPVKNSKRTVKRLFKKGQSGNPKGRPKGSKDKFTDLKKAFLTAFEDIGGVKSLTEWAKKNNHNKTQFYHMITKLLPKNVDITSGGEDLIRMLSEKYMPKKPKRK